MRVWMLCLLAATTLCASSLRADDPLAYIPADSGVVVRIAPRAELEKRLDGFLAAIGPRAGNSAAALDDVLGEIFAVGGGNARRAVDPASPIYLALFAYKDDEGRPLSPAPRAFFFKTADLDDVRKRLGAVESIDEVLTKKRDDGFEEIRTPRGLAFLAKRGDWAVLAVNEISLDALKLSAGQRKSLDSIDPAALKMLADGEIAAWVNVKQIWTVYERELAKGKEDLLKQLAELPAQLLGGETQAAATRQIYSTLLKGAYDLGSDAQWAGVTVGVSSDGVEIEKFVSLPPDSKAAKTLATQKPSEMELLDKLPQAAVIYLGLAIDYRSFDPTMFTNLLPGDDDYRARFKKSWEGIRESGVGVAAAATWFPTDAKSGFKTVQYQSAEKPDALLKASQEMFGTEGTKFTANGTTIEAKLEPAKEKYQNTAIDLITMKINIDIPDDNPGAAFVEPMLKQMYGGDTYHSRVAVVDGTLVQAGGNSPDVMHQAIDVFKSNENSLARTVAYGKTRERLLNEANVIGLLDAPKMVVDIVKMLRSSPAGAVMATLPFNFGRQPAASYTGFCATVEKTGVRARLFVPVEQPKEIMAIFSQAE